MCKKAKEIESIIKNNDAHNIRFVGIFVRLTGEVKSALFLSQLLYWTQRCDTNGWFYKTTDEWTEELGLSRFEQEKSRKKLRGLGVLEEKTAGMPRRKYYRLNCEKLHASLDLIKKSNSVGKSTNESEKVAPRSANNSHNEREKVTYTNVRNSHTECEKLAPEHVTNLRPSTSENSTPIRTSTTTDTTTDTTTEITTDTTPNAHARDGGVDKEIVCKVFDHWKATMHHPKAKLDDKRRKLIRQALKSGYSESDLCQAIDGCAITPHNQGENDRGQRYDGLHIILRDAEQIDRFMRNADNPPKPKNKAEIRQSQNANVVKQYLEMRKSGELTL